MLRCEHKGCDRASGRREVWGTAGRLRRPLACCLQAPDVRQLWCAARASTLSLRGNGRVNELSHRGLSHPTSPGVRAALGGGDKCHARLATPRIMEAIPRELPWCWVGRGDKTRHKTLVTAGMETL